MLTFRSVKDHDCNFSLGDVKLPNLACSRNILHCFVYIEFSFKSESFLNIDSLYNFNSGILLIPASVSTKILFLKCLCCANFTEVIMVGMPKVKNYVFISLFQQKDCIMKILFIIKM